jgi:transcriptional regulator with XRE-family HTH domain
MVMDSTDVGDRIRERRVALGMSLDTLFAHVTRELPEPRWGSTEMIRRIEGGKVPNPDPVYVAAIAAALDCTLRDLSPELAEEAAQLRRLLD